MLLGRSISVIIPALNEAASIGYVVREIPQFVDRIIVVDNGSEDETARIAGECGAHVIIENQRGYGAACLKGISAAGNSDLIAFIDGDYSDYPGDLEKVIRPVAEGRARLVIGCRQVFLGRGLHLHQRLGNWLACCFVRGLYGYRFRDLGPMRCISSDLLHRLDMSDKNYGWTIEMQIKVCQTGEKIIQVPVRYRKRIGQSKISGTLRGSILAGFKILYWSCRLFLKRKRSARAT